METKMDSYLELAKELGLIVVGSGATIICHRIVKHVSPEMVKPIVKIATEAGTMALSGIMASKCAEYADEKISQAIDILKKGLSESNEPNKKETVET